MFDAPSHLTTPATLDGSFAAASQGRPSWSGLLQIGLLAIPVKAYPAVVSAPELPAHLVHAGCGQRIRYARCCPQHGTLEAGAIARGYEVAPGQLLVLDEEELEQLRPARDRALCLDGFLDPSQVDPLLYSGRSLYLAPAALAARPAYALLTQALRQWQQAALGRLVLSGRRQLALLRAGQTLLVLHLLHYPRQLRSGAALEAQLHSGPVGVIEARLAGELLEAYRHPLRWADYRDDSAEALLALVQARLQGQAPAPPQPEPTTAPALLDALRQSVAALEKRATPDSMTRRAKGPHGRRSSS